MEKIHCLNLFSGVGLTRSKCCGWRAWTFQAIRHHNRDGAYDLITNLKKLITYNFASKLYAQLQNGKFYKYVFSEAFIFTW